MGRTPAKPKTTQSKLDAQLDAIDNPESFSLASPPPPAPPPPPPPIAAVAPTGEVLSKSDAIRRAIEDGHSKPKDGVEYIKKQFGIDVTPQMFSTTKLAESKKTGTQVSRGNGGRPKIHMSRPAPTTGGGTMDLARKVKELVREYGPDAVTEAVQLFSD